MLDEQKGYCLTYDRVTPADEEDGDPEVDHGFFTSGGWYDSTVGMDSSNAAELQELRDAASVWFDPDDDDDEQDGESAAVKWLARALRDGGFSEPSCCPLPQDADGVWFTQPDGDTDFRTGENTRLSLHPRGFTGAEIHAAFRHAFPRYP